jgi:hypothetical protein
MGAFLLVALLVLIAFEAPCAAMRILWRFAVLSYDDPATQVFDEMTCASSPPSRAGSEAGQSTHLGASSPGRPAPADVSPRLRSSALSFGVTRSPPNA